MAWLDKVGLASSVRAIRDELSGGQRKRVQMAQALITGPDVILMDEPFSALDIHTRHLMQNELLDLWQENRRAVVMITHDLEEAIALADRVGVLSAGPASGWSLGDFDVPLERPRDVAEIKLDPDVSSISIATSGPRLSDEVEKSHDKPVNASSSCAPRGRHRRLAGRQQLGMDGPVLLSAALGHRAAGRPWLVRRVLLQQRLDDALRNGARICHRHRPRRRRRHLARPQPPLRRGFSTHSSRL